MSDELKPDELLNKIDFGPQKGPEILCQATG